MVPLYCLFRIVVIVVIYVVAKGDPIYWTVNSHTHRRPYVILPPVCTHIRIRVSETIR